jgi:6-phospho-beta-glucosidase
MKLAILGGGGFRVPLVYGALLHDRPGSGRPRVDDVSLHDVDPARLAAIEQVLRQMAGGSPDAPRVSSTMDLDEALRDAAFVFSAIRVGGLAARVYDERVALDLGVLGQETTGPGGIAYGLRTIPAAMQVARRVAAVCPDAWVINFTNPAGMITESMQQVLGERVVGICDSPIGLGRRASRALGLDPDRAGLDYVGLNHLGWLRGVLSNGTDRLAHLIGDDTLLLGLEEGRLFGPKWIRALGMLPNEYLYYYYFTREAVAAIRGGAETRGEFLLRQQRAFYEHVASRPDDARAEWDRVRRERNATYMADVHDEDDEDGEDGGRDVADVEGGGYEGVALALMAAIARNEATTMILNVRNGTTVSGLPRDCVVEVPCAVGANGPQPLATRPLGSAELGLVQQVKAAEQLTIEAAGTGSAAAATKALAVHPLVDSVATARVLLEGYRAAIPEVAAVLR